MPFLYTLHVLPFSSRLQLVTSTRHFSTEPAVQLSKKFRGQHTQCRVFWGISCLVIRITSVVSHCPLNSCESARWRAPILALTIPWMMKRLMWRLAQGLGVGFDARLPWSLDAKSITCKDFRVITGKGGKGSKCWVKIDFIRYLYQHTYHPYSF